MNDQNEITPDGQVKRDGSQPRNETRNWDQSQYSMPKVTAASLAFNYIHGDAVSKQVIMANLDQHDVEFQRQFLEFANNPKSLPIGSGKLTRWTVNELLDTEFPEPIWLVPDMVPIGLVSLAGKP